MVTTDYRYKFEASRLTGRRQQKFQCPHCGRPKCFVRYVDTYNNYSYVADEVGKCDHEHSCGYHYKPSEYYRDHAWQKEPVRHPKPFSVLCSPEHQRGARTLNSQQKLSVPPPPPLLSLPMELVGQCHSPQSTFWQWFATDCARKLNLDPATLRRVYEDYQIGATSRGNIIFWQIDEKQQVRTGHIMQYRQDGRRHNGYQNWVHSERIFQDKVPKGFVLNQCFFGQHLLSLRPEDQVCLVESEKTALIMAAHQPQYLWLATCGSSGLNPEKLECLRGRRFILFPDSGCFGKWKKVMSQTEGLNYTISDRLEQYPANTDLADILLEPP